MDVISKWDQNVLIGSLGLEPYTIAKQHLHDARDTLSCLRWYARGLSLYDSIRKVMVDQEVRTNCIRQ